MSVLLKSKEKRNALASHKNQNVNQENALSPFNATHPLALRFIFAKMQRFRGHFRAKRRTSGENALSQTLRLLSPRQTQ